MRELVKLLLGVAAGMVMIVSALYWWSWQGLAQSDRYIEELASRGWIEDEKAWQRYYNALETQRGLLPLNPGVHWRMGELRRWRAAGLYLWPESRQAELEAARQQYTRAITQSPGNGNRVARAAARVSSVDTQLAIALARRALDMAPYEPVVQYHVAAVAFQHWEGLTTDTREQVRVMLSHVMQRGSGAAKIKRMAGRYGRLDVLARLGNDTG